ncbi:MAG: hypothetical protein ACE5GR_02110 [Nitrosopumilus sp.]
MTRCVLIQSLRLEVSSIVERSIEGREFIDDLEIDYEYLFR